MHYVLWSLAFFFRGYLCCFPLDYISTALITFIDSLALVKYWLARNFHWLPRFWDPG